MSQQKSVVDSPGWIEMVTNGPMAELCPVVFDAEAKLIVPAISILEVFKLVAAGAQ